MIRHKLYYIITASVVIGAGYLSGHAFFQKDEKERIESPSQHLLNRRSKEAVVVYKENEQNKLSPDSYSFKDLQRLINALSKKNDSDSLKKELTRLLNFPVQEDNKYQLLAMSLLFTRWGEIFPQQALEELKNLKGGWEANKYLLISPTLDSWIKKDPLTAYSYLQDDKNGLRGCNKFIIPMVAQSLARHSPDESWKWIATLSNKQQQSALESFFTEISDSYPEKMAEYMQALLSGKNSSTPLTYQDKEQLKKLTSIWATRNPEATLNWARTLPENWRNAAFVSLIEEQSKTNIKTAMELFAEMPEDSRELAIYAMQGQALTTNDPDKIINWINEVGKISPSMDLSNHVFDIVAFNDLTTIRDVMNKLPSGKLRDSLIYNYVALDRTPDYQEVIKIAETIENKELLDKTVKLARENADKASPGKATP